MKFKSEPWGDFTRDTLTDSNSGTSVSIVRDYSAGIQDLKIGGRKIIAEASDPQQYKNEIHKYSSCKLSPWPSRLRNASFSFKGKTYHLPKNDSSGIHSIHGLISFEKFSLKKQQENQLIYLHEFKGHEGFPFTFDIEIIYTLEARELIIETRYTNTCGEEFPLGDGWHHYFQAPEGLENYKISLPVDQMMVLDQDLLPSGEMKPFALRDASLSDIELDACFSIDKKNEGIAETILSGEGFDIVIWQETGKNKYNYLVVYTPGTRDQIAIEPLTCGVDMLNTGESMILLSPEKSLSLKMGIGVEMENFPSLLLSS